MVMKWEEVREAYPHTWVKLKILESHIDDDKKVIDDHGSHRGY